MDEQRIVAKLKAGQPRALEKLIDLYGGYVYSVAKGVLASLLSREDMEEVVSDVFAALWESRDRLMDGAPVKPYLAAIARNTSRKRLRGLRPVEPLEEDLPEEEGGPEELLTEQEEQEAVRLALLSMEPRDREIFLRHYYRCEPVREIAGAMGMNESTVKSRLLRGRQRLRAILTERGYGIEAENIRAAFEYACGGILAEGAGGRDISLPGQAAHHEKDSDGGEKDNEAIKISAAARGCRGACGGA